MASSTVSGQEAPAWFCGMRKLTTYVSEDFLGGPKLLKLAWVINFQKGGTFLFVGVLMKEASMSRYPQWADYKARTGMLLPKLW